MQSVRLKNLRHTDLVDPLRAYINQHFSAGQSSDLEPALIDIQMLRDQVVMHINASALDYERALHAHEEYLAVLIGLISRFPFGEIEVPKLFKKKDVSAVMVQWFASDSFRPQKLTVSYNVLLEQLTVCFNIGAIHSQQALSFERDSPNGIQSACKSLLRASGIFQSMAATMSGNFPNSLDLTSSSLSFLSNLMLAQAAALSFESAVRKPMAAGVLSVLAAGVAETYTQSKSALRSQSELTKWLSKSSFIDEKFLTYQIGCFESAAQHWQSEKDQADCKYGVVIARLQLAQQLSRSVASFEPANESSRVARKKLDDIVENKLKSAIHDNDTIYHYPIPSAAELPPIPAKTVVKPTPFVLPLGKLPHAFEGLVSADVQKAVQRFKAELAEEVDALSNVCLDSTDVCRSALSEMNLPAALDALDADTQIPKNMIDKLIEIRNAGGLATLQNFQKEIQEMSSNAWAIRDEINRMLDQELANEDRFRNHYQQSWERTPSTEINSPYLRDLKTVTKYLEQAKDADAKINTLFANSIDILKLVSKPIGEIESTLPVLDKSAKSETSEKVRSVLHELSSLIRNRDHLIDEFSKTVESFDPIPIILGNKSSSVEEVLKNQKSRFETNRKAVDENLAKQSQLFDALVEANQRFVQSHRVSETEEQRQRCLQNINEGVAAFEKMHRNFAEGISFYTDICNDYLKPLKDNVLGFVTARDHEARLLLDDISRRFGQVSISDKGNPDSRAISQQDNNGMRQNPSAPATKSSSPLHGLNESISIDQRLRPPRCCRHRVIAVLVLVLDTVIIPFPL